MLKKLVEVTGKQKHTKKYESSVVLLKGVY